MDILGPVVESSLFKQAVALADSTLVEAKHFDTSACEVSSPKGPRYVGIMPLRRERTHEQQARGWFLDPVMHGI
jgi:hypothetical protein